VQLPDTTNEGADVAFAGRYESSRDGLDCVAIFDGSSWRLELVQGLVRTLKATGCGHLGACIAEVLQRPVAWMVRVRPDLHRRSSLPGRGVTPPPQAPAAAADDVAAEDGVDVADDLEAALGVRTFLQ
jgi:hypothetical protein